MCLEKDNALLLTPFSDDEFHRAVLIMHLDKALGPNGMNHAFYQKIWHITGPDAITACSMWLSNCAFVKYLYDMMIVVLIPKNDNPATLKDFRLIS